MSTHTLSSGNVTPQLARTRTFASSTLSSGAVRVIKSSSTSFEIRPASIARNQNVTLDAYPLDIEIVPPTAVPLDTAVARTTDTSPIQVWEGEVLEVDRDSDRIYARLRSKTGSLPDHNATIDQQWVHEQDADLVKPGAVFYVTLYKSRNRGSLRNAQEIRFRRLPNWSSADIQRINALADELLMKVVTPGAVNGR
jgi:hypothetical protein